MDMLTKNTFIKGLKNGFYVTWDLAKIIVPVYFAVTFLKYTPVLPWISKHMEPMMFWFGLPGEASLAIVMGYFVNIYAAIGAFLPLGLSSQQITVLAGMLLMAHSLPIETTVSKKTGIQVKSLIAIRLSLSVLMGLALNWLI